MIFKLWKASDSEFETTVSFNTINDLINIMEEYGNGCRSVVIEIPKDPNYRKEIIIYDDWLE